MKTHFDGDAIDWDKSLYRIRRTEIFARAIGEAVPLTENMAGLDFGCGTGLLGYSLIDRLGHMTFWDTSDGMIEEVSRKASDFPGKVTAKTYDIFSDTEQGCFDIIVTLQALHHIQDAKGAVIKLTKHLKAGGYLCLADLSKEDGSFHGREQETHHNGFDVSEMVALLEKQGMAWISTSYPFTNEKEVEGKIRHYPVFLIIFRKP